MERRRSTTSELVPDAMFCLQIHHDSSDSCFSPRGAVWSHQLTGSGSAVRGGKDSWEMAADVGAKLRQSDSIRQALKGAAERRATVPDQPFSNTALHISENAIGALQPLNDPIRGAESPAASHRPPR
ncbi:hypothetical protein SRHO_G00000340 [Serrasalmus rhombeus]